MRPQSLIMALAAVVIMAASPICAGEKPAFGNINGCLIDAATGLPLVDARVVLIETNQGVQTDSSGCFEIAHVKPGTYHLAVTPTGLGEVKGIPELAVTVSAGQTSRISVSLQAKRKNPGKQVEKPATDYQQVIDNKELGKTKSEGPAVSDSRSTSVAGCQIITIDGLAGLDKNSAGLDRRQKCAPAPNFEPRWDNNRAPEDMFFRDYGTNGFVDTRRDPFSTFAVDVDDASYNIVHRYLQDGLMPPQEAVRVEEFINHFNYGYNGPSDETFRVFTEITNSPFERDRYLLKLAVKGREIAKFERHPLNLTFVIDVSGSMNEGNRFDLVRESIKTLVRQLNGNDRVGIVAYGSHAFVVLEPIAGNESREICRAVDELGAGGSTYAEAGIRLGYEMANSQYVNGHNNVIVLCSDGVANVGRTSPDAIMAEVQRFARQGITLSTFGYGMGNYNDVLLEQLAIKGNGRYAYINGGDDIRTAMVDNFVGNFQVLARDVKVQVEFNTRTVAAYRLLGYENRAVADERFRDNRQDGGEVGAGHEVTAVYELEMNRGCKTGSLATINVRWKNAEGTEVFELAREARMNEHYTSFDKARPELRLAVVAGRFAEMLKGTGYADNTPFESLYRLAQTLRRDLPGEQTDDLVDMIDRAGDLSDRHAERDDRGDDDYGDYNYKR